MEGDRFVTFFYAQLDGLARRLRYANAGHSPPIIYRKSLNTYEEAAPRDIAGFPLGVAEGIPYDAATINLEPGDCLVQFTDGVSEARRGGEDSSRATPRIPRGAEPLRSCGRATACASGA